VVRLRVFQQSPGFPATEERQGAATVYRTLGLLDTREAAEACIRRRAEQLQAQRSRKAQSAA